ncbi:MAG: flavoprotein [Alphaproteobacteria bacterium]|nr:flavoprotein [Alphaproteobacteria bacterium]
MSLPIAVIGAGPVGLAAAAHLLERGLTPLVLEAGPQVGHAVRQWAHVQMFSPWGFTTDRAARALLEATGWKAPPSDEVPTGGDLITRYLEPLARHPAVRPHLRFNTKVVSVGRKDFDKVKTAGRDAQPFALEAIDAGGNRVWIEARAVIDASGTWSTPNPIGSGGLAVPGEDDVSDRIAYGIPDVLGQLRDMYRDKAVMVVGSGHSALNALLELTELQVTAPATRILWATRREQLESAFGGGAADALPERGALGLRAKRAVEDGRIEVLSPFRIAKLARRNDGAVEVEGTLHGNTVRIAADRLIVATGFRPDFGLLREVRLDLDPWLESTRALGPLIDPNLHSCGTVRPHGAKELAHPETDFYIAGMKSYGRAPTFLLATGHEQVRSIAAALAGDHEAAARVELELPQTGVCNATPKVGKALAVAEAAGGCCGGPAPAGADACCVADVEAKAAGESGCGCGPAETESASAVVAGKPRVKVPAGSSGCSGD